MARPLPLPLAAAALVLATAGVLPAAAQPEPSFRVPCSGLRAAIDALKWTPEDYVTIQVVGPLTGVHAGGALAYVTVCDAPDPRVLCVTYSTNGRKAGDLAVVSGAFTPRGPDHVQLDPCLHSAPD